METTITVTEAARSFSDLINRVYYRGDTAILTRNGIAVARIVPEGSRRCTGAEFGRAWGARQILTRREAAALARRVAAGRREMNRPVEGPRWG